ncbi:MAG: hypothetical protein FWC61_04450 [Proteobacteria bacterium]|nr:hypothetical protein [Pseudomonadota bacterium]
MKLKEMTEKERIYKELAESFVTYVQLLSVSKVDASADKEPFVVIPRTGSGVVARPELARLMPCADDIVVRESVMEKLLLADRALKSIKPDCQLVVFYGWRAPSVQKKAYEARCAHLRDKYVTEEELRKIVHSFVFAPKLTGHSAGAAVDVLIYDSAAAAYLDFGTEIEDTTDKNIVYAAPGVGTEARKNRKILRDVMKKAGFAPFDGLWWHFSYGDQGWAIYNGRKSYLYSLKKQVRPKSPAAPKPCRSGGGATGKRGNTKG